MCDPTLGLALTPPPGWTVAPSGKSAPDVLSFSTVKPGVFDPILHLVIGPLGVATACGDAQAAAAVAHATVRAVHLPRPIQRTPVTVGGAPAVMLGGLPGEPDFALEIVVAHAGLVYGMFTFDRAWSHRGYPALTLDQRRALSSLRFTPRVGPFPRPAGPPDHAVTAALRTCGAAYPSPRAFSAASTAIFCAWQPASGTITLVPRSGGAPPLVRFALRRLPPRTIVALFVDQGPDRGAYNITRGVPSDGAGRLARAVPAFRPPEKAPRLLLVESYQQGALLVNAVAYPC